MKKIFNLIEIILIKEKKKKFCDKQSRSRVQDKFLTWKNICIRLSFCSEEELSPL